MNPRRLATTAILALSCLTAGATRTILGQEVTGTVVDAATSAPVRGAVIVLLGTNRAYLARTVTSSSGTFRLQRDSATTIRVMRIGYSPHESRLGNAASALRISLTPLGQNLRAVAVRSRPICPARRDQREALAHWSAATDALLAMVVSSTDKSHSGTVTQLLFDRLMSDDGRRIVRQSTRRLTTDNVTPIRADRDPDEFVDDGYVVRRGNITTYYGPDPEILLDSSFAETHCLSIRVDARAHPGEVGVAFTPTRDRDSVPDIAGVLWLSRSPVELRSLTFEYRGVDVAVMDIRAGGLLEFETMSDGVPLIRSWFVRSPKLRYLAGGRYVGGNVVRGADVPVVSEIHETGGMIVDGILTDGTRLTMTLATLGGRVLNARTEETVAGARVTIDSTDVSTVTDSTGQFSLPGLLPGPYTIRSRDSVTIHTMRVDSTGELVPDTTVQQVVTRTATMDLEVRLGDPRLVDVRLPWRTRVDGCGPGEEVERRYTVLGVVLTKDSLPVANVAVRLNWADSTRGNTVETQVDAVADTSGTFVMCGIPARRLTTRVVTTSGVEFLGSTTVPRVEHDEQGRPRRNNNLRAVQLFISSPGRD